MKILIVEDEILAYKKLVRLLNSIDSSLVILENTQSVEETVNWLIDNPKPDLILMDIQLEDGVCFEIFEKMKIEIPIIFTTAYDQYAISAFKVNSVDYLLKPVNQKDLETALNKFQSIYANKNQDGIEKIIEGFNQNQRERFLVKVGEHYRSIISKEINHVYILEKNVFIHTTDNKTYPSDYSLDQMDTMLNPDIFFRINRNYIVNINSIGDIISYSSSRLKISLKNWSNKENLIISRERVTNFKIWMGK